MISLVGTAVPDRSATDDAMVRLIGASAAFDLLDVDDGEVVELDVSGWSAAAVAEALAPGVDGRIPAQNLAAYVTQLALVHRMADCFDAGIGNWPEDAAGLREALGAQLRLDCEATWIWDAWATALTREDDADRPTVADGVLEWLDEIESAALGNSPAVGAGAGAAARAGAHHAGALHTYGYLCSNLWTKYGWKRTRWLGGGIAAAAGISAELLGPVPPSGTLLGNATVLAGRLLGWKLPPGAASTTAVTPTARLVGRVVEVATEEQTPDGLVRFAEPLEIRTSLFRRDDPPTVAAPNLLIYTLVQSGVERLVTVFDVDAAKVQSLLAPPPEELGEAVALRLRYNAWVEGIGTSLRGSRAATCF